MFNLDEAMAEWRTRMVAAGIKSPAVLDELESHLREDVDERMRSGSNAPEAFAAAEERLGQANRLKAEFEQAEGRTALGSQGWLRAFAMGLGILMGICFLGFSAFGLLRHELGAWHRVLGFSALGAMGLLGSGSFLLSRRFLGPAEPRLKTVAAFGGPVVWIAWMLGFFHLILPHCELEIASLIVALLWALVPGAVLVGTSLGLAEGQPKRSAAS
jgi:hypothetical protein